MKASEPDPMNELAEARLVEETADVLTTIGRRIRQLRLDRGLSLQALGQRTGLSASMLSLLERGKTGPSIGTLVVIASALGAQMSDFLEMEDEGAGDTVSRSDSQKIYETSEGVMRRILKHDRARGVEIAINEYSAGTANNSEPRGHEGYEYGVLLEGSMTITIGEETHELKPGDLISYNSTVPHRIANAGKTRARALWINMKRA